MKKGSDIEGQERVTMWAVQTERVLECLERDGIYYVKNRYITEKYGDAAWIFKEAYHFFTSHACHIVEKPSEADSPIWMFRDKRWAVPGEGAYCLELSIPWDEIILFDMRLWSKVLNLSYMGTEEQEKAFEEKLKKMGVTNPLDIFQKPYYPLLKAEVLKSWEMLFKVGCGERLYEQGAVWKLRKEWLPNYNYALERV